MGMVATKERIASGYAVFWGPHGAVSRLAQQRSVCRQWIYRQAHQVTAALEGNVFKQRLVALETQVQELRQGCAGFEQRLAVAVVLDDETQARFATVGQACGVSLSDCWALLDVLIPGQVLSVATLGRRTKAAGEQAGKLLAVLDPLARDKVRDAAADEIYVTAPVLMVVEQESLCWVSGQLSDEVTGVVWSQQFGLLPHLEQVARDEGKALRNGVALVNAQRQAEGRQPAVDQSDHFHATRGGGVALHVAQTKTRQALAEAEEAEAALAACTRRGQARTKATNKARWAWQRAERAMDEWIRLERVWQQIKEALPLFNPEGELNTRARAEAVLAQTLPQLPDTGFAKTKRMLQKPELLSYLDRVQTQLAALPVAEEVKQAAVNVEGMRRRPELLQGVSPQAAAQRGVVLACSLVLSLAGAAGQQAVAGVRDIVRRAYRASSLVECINSVLRMQQARHRKMTQGLLDLKRLYWNCHVFRTGRRKGTSPYQRLGLIWPEGLRCWDVLKLTPEQLRDKLSTAKTAA
jgi:hypothetical protein